jgi:hypothetical protein
MAQIMQNIPVSVIYSAGFRPRIPALYHLHTFIPAKVEDKSPYKDGNIKNIIFHCLIVFCLILFVPRVGATLTCPPKVNNQTPKVAMQNRGMQLLNNEPNRLLAESS